MYYDNDWKPTAGWRGAPTYSSNEELEETAFQTGRSRESVDSQSNAEWKAYNEIITKANELDEDHANPWENSFTYDYAGNGRAPTVEGVGPRKEKFNTWREGLAEKYKDQKGMELFSTDIGKLSEEMTRRDKTAFEDADRRSSNTWESLYWQTAGFFEASMADPAQAAFMVGTLGVGTFAKLGWQMVLRNALKLGVTMGSGELAAMLVADQHATASGVPLTTGEYVGRVGGAFAGTAGLDLLGRGITRQGARIIGRETFQDPVTGLVKTRKKGTGPVEPPRDASAMRPIQQAQPETEGEAVEVIAQQMGEDSALYKGLNGSEEDTLAAIKKLPEATKDGDIADAVKAYENRTKPDAETEAAVKNLDERDVQETLEAGVRHFEDPANNPAPRAPDEIPPAKGPNLSDDVPTPKGRVLQVDGKPVYKREVDVSDATLDPERFQFRAENVNKNLEGVTAWDETAANKVFLYEELDETLVTADGHGRIKKGQELKAQGQDIPPLDAYVYRAKDGWTVDDVKAFAAKKNMQEGSGEPLDVAKILRARPDVLDQSIPMTGAGNRQGRHIAKLSDEAFDSVVAGVIPPRQAALVGEMVPEQSKHAGIVNELAELKLQTPAQARAAIDDMARSPEFTETTVDMFGAIEVSRPLRRERAKVFAAAVTKLKSNSRLFKMLQREASTITSAGNTLAKDANAAAAESSEQALELITRATSQEGRLSKIINEKSRDVASGAKTVAKAADEYADEVQEIFEKEGIKGIMQATEHSEVFGKMDDPFEGAADQIQRLKDDMPEMFGDQGELTAPKAKPKAKDAPAEPKLSKEDQANMDMATAVNKLRNRGLGVDDFDEAVESRKMADIVKGCKLI